MPWMSICLSFEDRAEMSDFESDQKVTEVSPEDTASRRTALTARASAMRAEPTWLRFVDMDRVDPEVGSLKIHPKPPIQVAEIHAASTKHCVSLSRGVERDNLLTIG